jgi:ATP-dependent DNA helicase DinG
VRFALEFIVAGDDKRYVYWMERRGRGVFLRASPIDVSTLLQDKLFERVETIVMTSATLASAGSFTFARERLGLTDDKTDELIAPSSYDYQNQSVLYLPPRMPVPSSPQWAEAAAAEVLRILEVTQGRAFVLSTSLSGMRSLYERVAPQVDFPCLMQGTASKTGCSTASARRRTPCSSPLRVSGRALTCAGDALSCVIIDKLPFAVPSDPIVAARQRFIEDAGGSSFYEYSVPQAIISLEAGAGAFDPQRDGPGRALRARPAPADASLRATVHQEPAALPRHFRPRGGGARV